MFYLCSIYVLLCAISYFKFPPSYFSCIEEDVKLCNDSRYSFFVSLQNRNRKIIISWNQTARLYICIKL